MASKTEIVTARCLVSNVPEAYSEIIARFNAKNPTATIDSIQHSIAALTSMDLLVSALFMYHEPVIAKPIHDTLSGQEEAELMP